ARPLAANFQRALVQHDRHRVAGAEADAQLEEVIGWRERDDAVAGGDERAVVGLDKTQCHERSVSAMRGLSHLSLYPAILVTRRPACCATSGPGASIRAEHKKKKARPAQCAVTDRKFFISGSEFFGQATHAQPFTSIPRMGKIGGSRVRTPRITWPFMASSREWLHRRNF